MRRLAIVGVAREGVGAEKTGEALAAYFDGWQHLAAAGVGVEVLKGMPVCAASEERAPPNVITLLQFLLYISTRSGSAITLASQIVLGLFCGAVPLLYMVLLMLARKPITDSMFEATNLSTALSFLYQDFKPIFFW